MLYLGTDNKLYHASTAVTFGSCRAVFQLANALPGSSLGDVNGDGDINVTDVTTVVDIILHSATSIVNVVTNLDDAPITFGGFGSDPARIPRK